MALERGLAGAMPEACSGGQASGLRGHVTSAFPVSGAGPGPACAQACSRLRPLCAAGSGPCRRHSLRVGRQPEALARGGRGAGVAGGAVLLPRLLCLGCHLWQPCFSHDPGSPCGPAFPSADLRACPWRACPLPVSLQPLAVVASSWAASLSPG